MGLRRLSKGFRQLVKLDLVRVLLRLNPLANWAMGSPDGQVVGLMFRG
jgi:hypothetical protein